jgi:hypothetical protein
MVPIAPKDKEIISTDPYYKKCARAEDGGCAGRITIEHACTYAGKQIAELWNYVPICEYHHGVLSFQDRGDLIKEKNVWIALNQATDEELNKFYKSDFKQRKQYLNSKYGTYNHSR